MKKYSVNTTVVSCENLNDAYALIKLQAAPGNEFPQEILPGQFVQIEIPSSKTTYLRRPISINYFDHSTHTLWLLVRNAGEGTRHLIESKAGDAYNLIMPLGRPFSTPEAKDGKILLVGGGVGVAPLLYLGQQLQAQGVDVHFALGARTAADLLEINEFEKYGTVHVSTEDGSAGEKGFITQHSVFSTPISHIACCGPTPMMKAVAKIAADKDIYCEVSLENMMACGLGACLCCVEDTKEGHLCVCTEGPVFDIKRLNWN